MWHPTNKSHKAVAKIAKKDIPIIKVGTSEHVDTFTSYFMCCHYKLHRMLPEVKIRTTRFGTIEEGYHFFKSNMVKVITKRSGLTSILHPTWPCVCIYGRFPHMYSDIHSFCEKDLVIAKGYIPRGTIYYLNSCGNGVAEQIVLTEVTKLQPC